MQFAGGIMSVVKSISLLKAGLGGIAGAGIYLIIEDLVSHFRGGKSAIFDIYIPAIEKLKEKLGLDLDFSKITTSLKNLGESFSDLMKTLTDSATVEEAFKKGLEGILITVDTLISGIEGLLVATSTFINLANLAFGDKDTKDKARKALLQNYETFASNKVTAPIMKLVEGAVDFAGVQRENHAIVDEIKKLYDSENRYNGGKKIKIDYANSNVGTQAMIDKYLGNGGNAALIEPYVKLNDGIIQPSGKITSVSPDDWVFAVKDVADLAGALLPPGITNNSVTNAPVNYVINQNLSVNGSANAMQVKQMAYSGTAEALKQNIYTASRYMQQMPGTK